jgi:hypothetical protein
MSEEFGSFSRGAKAISKPTQRGYATFAHQKPCVVLLEPFFCTGSEVQRTLMNHMKKRDIET